MKQLLIGNRFVTFFQIMLFVFYLHKKENDDVLVEENGFLQRLRSVTMDSTYVVFIILYVSDSPIVSPKIIVTKYALRSCLF